MSDAYELLDNGSSIIGDTWEMLNDLNGGGIGQIIENIDGTVIDKNSIIGYVYMSELGGSVITDNLKGTIDDHDIMGTVEKENMEGSIWK